MQHDSLPHSGSTTCWLLSIVQAYLMRLRDPSSSLGRVETIRTVFVRLYADTATL